MEIFNLRKVSELEIRKQYQTETSNSFVALEKLNNSEDIHMAWENIKENVKSSAKEGSERMKRSRIFHGLLENV